MQVQAQTIYLYMYSNFSICLHQVVSCVTLKYILTVSSLESFTAPWEKRAFNSLTMYKFVLQTTIQKNNGRLQKALSPKHVPIYQPNVLELNDTISSSDSDTDDNAW